MTKFKHWEDDFGSALISTVIGEDKELIDKMEVNEDGTYSIIFSIGGAELDFNKVVSNIKNNLNNLITSKALLLLSNKYNGLLEEINIIQELLEKQRENIEWE